MSELNQKVFSFALGGNSNTNLSNLPQVQIYVNGILNPSVKFSDLFEKGKFSGSIIKGYSFLQFSKISEGKGIVLDGNAIQIFVGTERLALYKIKDPDIIMGNIKVKETLKGFVKKLVDFKEAVISKYSFIDSEKYVLKEFTFINKKYLFAFSKEDEPQLFAISNKKIVRLALDEKTNTDIVRTYEVTSKDEDSIEFSIAYNVDKNSIGPF